MKVMIDLCLILTFLTSTLIHPNVCVCIIFVWVALVGVKVVDIVVDDTFALDGLWLIYYGRVVVAIPGNILVDCIVYV